MAALIAAAAGDAATLLKLAIELNGAVVARDATITELRSADEARRAKQAERTRRSRNATQRDVTLQSVTDRDVTQPSPPSPSLLPPTPPNNPSSPPSPLLPPPLTAEEERLRLRAPEAWGAVGQFLDGKDDIARRAWIGRFHGAMDRSPHPTGQELADALGDLMTRPREDWVPPLFREYVGRMRRDATRRAEKDAAAPRAAIARAAAGADAGAVFAKIRTLVNTATVIGHAPRRFIRRADVEALGERALRAYDEIGGADRFLDPDETVGFVLRDFERAYARAGAAPLTGALS